MRNENSTPPLIDAVDALRVDQELPTEELKLRAKQELSEDEETVARSLDALRSMLDHEENLFWQDDDLFLLAFLRAKKFDVEKALNLLKGLYRFFGKHGSIYYNDMNIDYLKRLMEENSLIFLPYRRSQGSVVAYFRFSSWNPESISPVEHIICGTLGCIQALLSPSTQVAGFSLIMDFKGCSLNHLLHITPSVLLSFSNMVQDTVPVRVSSVHVINQNYVFTSVWNVLKRFFSKKMRERLHVHGKDIKGLHKICHPSILPADLGGELPPFNNAEWRDRMETSFDYIKHVLSHGYVKYLKRDWRKKSIISIISNRSLS